MQTNKIERVEFEIVGTDNPLNINIGGVGHILSIELEKFVYTPNTNPNIPFIGIDVNGLKNKWNSNGQGCTIIKTIDYSGGQYKYQDMSDDDVLKLGTNECNLLVSFFNRLADKNNLLNPTKIVFDNNYLLNFSLLIQKY